MRPIEEIQHRSTQAKQRAEAAFLQGEWPGGALPVGFRWDRTRRCFDTTYALSAVVRIFRLYLEGSLGAQGIADVLLNEGICKEDGEPWQAHQIERILGNPFYAGFLTRRVQDQITQEWIEEHRPSRLIPSVLSESEWRRVQEIRKGRNNRVQFTLDDLLPATKHAVSSQHNRWEGGR